MRKLIPLHQGISVPDVDTAAVWYQDVFGFEVVSEEFAPPLNCRIVFVEKDGFQLELFQYMGEDGNPLPEERRIPNEDIKTCGTKHVAYGVADMAEMVEHLKEKRVDIAMPPFPMNGDLVCFIRDNSGTLIELIQKDALKK